MFGKFGKLGNEVETNKTSENEFIIFGGGNASTESSKVYDFEDAPSQYDSTVDKIFDLGNA